MGVVDGRHHGDRSRAAGVVVAEVVGQLLQHVHGDVGCRRKREGEAKSERREDETRGWAA